jgi:hypothetical protein
MRTLPGVLLVVLLASAAPAAADSTTSGSVPPGGSLRSSTDAAPSPANPVIATVTTAGAFANGSGPCRVNCSDDEGSTITIAMKDKRDRTNGPGIEGPSGYDFLGPQIDISTSQNPPNNVAKVVFEIDASLVHPDFTEKPSEHFSRPFSFKVYRPGDRASGDLQTSSFDSVEQLPGGDVRITAEKFAWAGSWDLFQESWYALLYATRTTLPDTLRRGLPVWLKTNYLTAIDMRVQVTPAVARTLKLKSTTLGQRSYPKGFKGDMRIPFTAAARKALRRYSRVRVSVVSVAKGPKGWTKRGSRAVVLKKPARDLER